jgi:GT2 family glycosyltransferase
MEHGLSDHESIAAVVVSYNRRELLKQVLDSVRVQSRRVDEIIVVENGSTDGTRELLRAGYPDVFVVECKVNGGGAGGFARGLAWASARGHQYAWIMDDDAIPAPECLERLEGAFIAGMCESFAAPRVLDDSGRTGPRGFPVVADHFADLYRTVGEGMIAIKASTFVGPLISLNVAVRTHAPLEDFFIWHDDIEYTSRLAQLGTAVSVPDATIMHLASNPGPDHYNGARNFYNLRNLIWWRKEARRNGTFNWRALTDSIRVAIKRQYIVAPKKASYLKVLLRALLRGIFNNPRKRDLKSIASDSKKSDQFVGRVL